MPISIADLPPELLPELLAPLVARRDLYAVCLVCRDWRDVGQRRLFNHVRLFGRDLAIAPQLFQTLASNPRLAALVRRLEVRVYPISLKVTEQAETERLAIAMLRKCINCEELVWTRKGALTDSVWSAIHAMPRLRSLELNAHTNLSPGSWSAENLVSLRPLQSLSLILPDRNVANILPDFFARQNASSNEGGQLEEFSVLCRESPVVNNAVLRAIAPFLARSRLTSLALAGCSKLGGDPLLELLPTLPLLRHLALEACNLEPRFYTQIAPSLCRLASIKLTHPGPRHPSVATFFPAIEGLLAALPQLTAFTLYHSGASADGRREWPVLPESFARNVVTSNGAVLRKFEVSGILCTVTAAEVLAEGARNLRNLVLHLGADFDLDRLTSAFSPLEHLRTLHLLSQRATVSLEAVLELAQHCSPTLRQIGFRNRVWIVKRNYHAEGEGPKTRFYETAAAFGAFRRNRYGAESDVESEVEEASSASSDSDSESDA